MNVDVVLLPQHLRREQVAGRAVVVFDVLRATTTIAAALASGAKEVRVFDALDRAVVASGRFGGSKLLCGEMNCLPPAGFDLGNSPGAFTPEACAGRTLFMSTTNGTRAIVAAAQASRLYAAALVNASATALALASDGLDVTLLCAGTQGAVSMEDVLGAGAVLSALRPITSVRAESDAALLAERFYEVSRPALSSLLRQTQGGRNVFAAGLEPDIDFAARVDALDVVALVEGDPPTVRPRAARQ